MEEDEVLKLIEIAIDAREKAYAPYSNFKVGAVIVDNDDRITIGANIENGSYGLTNCAERTAIFSAKVNGMKTIKKIVVVADTTAPVSPCGACRQVLSEFSDNNTEIILANLKMDYKIFSLEEILPYGFKL